MQKFTILEISKSAPWVSINWKDLPDYTCASSNYITKEDIDKFVDWRVKEISKVFGVNTIELKQLVVARNKEFYVELDKFYSKINGRALYNPKFQEILLMFKLPDTRAYTSKTYKFVKYILKRMYLSWKKFKEETLFNENY